LVWLCRSSLQPFFETKNGFSWHVGAKVRRLQENGIPGGKMEKNEVADRILTVLEGTEQDE